LKTEQAKLSELIPLSAADSVWWCERLSWLV
jgi:hypothetical protein